MLHPRIKLAILDSDLCSLFKALSPGCLSSSSQLPRWLPLLAAGGGPGTRLPSAAHSSVTRLSGCGLKVKLEYLRDARLTLRGTASDLLRHSHTSHFLNLFVLLSFLGAPQTLKQKCYNFEEVNRPGKFNFSPATVERPHGASSRTQTAPLSSEEKRTPDEWVSTRAIDLIR